METNYLAAAVASLIPLAVGAVWYNPKLFGQIYQNPKNENQKPGHAPMVYLVSLLVSVLAALYLDKVVNHAGEPEFQYFTHGMRHGLILGAMAILPVFIVHSLFEGKGFKYALVHAGYWIVSFGLMGGILSAWHTDM